MLCDVAVVHRGAGRTILDPAARHPLGEYGRCCSTIRHNLTSSMVIRGISASCQSAAKRGLPPPLFWTAALLRQRRTRATTTAAGSLPASLRPSSILYCSTSATDGSRRRESIEGNCSSPEWPMVRRVPSLSSFKQRSTQALQKESSGSHWMTSSRADRSHDHQ